MSFDFSRVCGFVMWKLQEFLAAHTWQQSPRFFVRLGYRVEWQDFFCKDHSSPAFAKTYMKSSSSGGKCATVRWKPGWTFWPTLGIWATLRLPLGRCTSTTQTKHPFLQDKPGISTGACRCFLSTVVLSHFSVSAFTGKFRGLFTFEGLNLFNGL